jgi:hypothetical protein
MASPPQNRRRLKRTRVLRPAGLLVLEEVTVERQFSFLDYIFGYSVPPPSCLLSFRGMEVSLIVGVDFTRSNGSPEDESSLHYINEEGTNDYITAVASVGSILEYYDSDKKYPVYGFGGKLPPSHSVSTLVLYELYFYFHPIYST